MSNMSRALATAVQFPRDVLRSALASRHAPFLTHGSLALLFAIEFTLILKAPFWLMLPPCILIHHRIGILLHEYMHGIPLRGYRDSLRILTFANSLLLTFGFQEIFRGTHLEHHRWLNTDRDPGYWTPPKGGPDSVLLRPFWIVYRALVGDHGPALYVKAFGLHTTRPASLCEARSCPRRGTPLHACPILVDCSRPLSRSHCARGSPLLHLASRGLPGNARTQQLAR